MRKYFTLVLLTLMLLCMMPLYGDTTHHSDHLNLIDSAVCASCLVTVDVSLLLVFLRPVSFTSAIIPKLLEFLPIRVLFQPPRFLS